MRKLIAAAMLAMGAALCGAKTVCDLPRVFFSYSFANGEATVTRIFCYDGQVIQIPEAVDGRPVVAIADEACMMDRETGKLVISPKICIPKTVRRIGAFAIAYCKIDDIEVDPSNTCFKAIGGVLYSKDGKTLVRCPYGKQTVEIPKTVEKLNAFAFAYTDVRDLVIPEGVVEIGPMAFQYCTELTSVVFAASVRRIYGRPFGMDQKLRSVFFEGDAPAFDADAFRRVPNEELVLYVTPDSKGWNCAIPGTWNDMKIDYFEP